MITVDVTLLSRETLALVEAFKSRGSLPGHLTWPVYIDGVRTYLSYEARATAIEELEAQKLIRLNSVSGQYVWKGPR